MTGRGGDINKARKKKTRMRVLHLVFLPHCRNFGVVLNAGPCVSLPYSLLVSVPAFGPPHIVLCSQTPIAGAFNPAPWIPNPSNKPRPAAVPRLLLPSLLRVRVRVRGSTQVLGPGLSSGGAAWLHVETFWGKGIRPSLAPMRPACSK